MFYKHFKTLPASRKLAVSGLFWAIIFVTAVVRAQIVNWPQTLPLVKPQVKPYFVVPNEKKPEDIIPILEQASEGLLITVGSERGFITASFSEKIKAVLFLDSNEGISYFNKINIALLRASENREDYLKLRLFSKYEEWVSASKKLNSSDPSYALLNDSETYQWWKKTVMDNADFDLFHNTDGGRARRQHKEKTGFNAFKNSSYLEEDVLFNRISNLAKGNKLQALTVDLAYDAKFENIVQQLHKSNFPVSVIDISNAWTLAFMSEQGTVKFIRNASKAASNSSFLITTRPTPGKGDVGWRYEAFTFKKIYSYDSLSTFYHSALVTATLPLAPFSLLNGKRAAAVEPDQQNNMLLCLRRLLSL